MPFAAVLVFALFFAIASPAVAFDDPPISGASTTDAAITDADLQALPEALQPAAKQMLGMLKLDQEKDAAKLKAMLAAMQAQAENAPEQAKPLMKFIVKKMQARIDALQDAGGDASTAVTTDAKIDATTDAKIDATTDAKIDATTDTAEVPVTAPASAAAQVAMDSFIHSVLIGRSDLAKAAAEVLLNTQTTAAQAADIVDRGGYAERFDRAVEAARSMLEVSGLAAQVGMKVEAGRLDLARDPIRIDRAVAMLTGTLRQQTFAMRSLEASGTYAMPALIQAFTAGSSPSQELMAERAILNIGRGAVVPLSEALAMLPTMQQVRVIRVLGQIGSRIAAPWMLSVASAKNTTSDLRKVVDTALASMGVSSLDLGVMWSSLARSFIIGVDGLLPYPSEMHQPTWTYDADHGLIPKFVATNVYCDVMAQRCAAQAMNCDPNNGTALGIYLAAGLRLEAQKTPTEIATALSPTALAQAAGPMVAMQVLGLGIDIKDSGLQLQAIHAISTIGGASNLIAGGEQNPLIQSLDSANRRVRIESALAFARALPTASFPRADTVVPTLASTLREGGRPAVSVIAMQTEDRTQIEGWLRAQNFQVLASAQSANDMRTASAGRGSPDLIVVAGDPTFVNNQGLSLRSNSLTSNAMLLLAIPEQDAMRVDRSLRDDRSANLWFVGSSDATFRGAIGVLMNRASGGMPTAEQMKVLANDASDALIGIGRAGGGVFRMLDAEIALIDGLAHQQGDLRGRIAAALALVPSQPAQRALLMAALDAQDMDQTMLLLAAAESARRIGDKAEPGQVERLRKLLVESKDSQAAAAAECYGALNLGPQESIKLILK